MWEFCKTLNGSIGIQIFPTLINGLPRTKKAIEVNFSLQYNKRHCPTYEVLQDDIWEKKVKQNNRLFNGSKFRFADIALLTENCVLNIGITSYKDLITTNCSEFGKHLQEHGILNFGDAQSCLADPLGVGAMILTKDLKFLFMKRALWTGEDCGKFDRTGGHAEPDVSMSSSSKLEIPENGYQCLSNADVKNEIFNSILREINEEINVPLNTLSEPQLLGIVRSLERFGRPSAEFLVRCCLTSEEIKDYYLQNTQPDADESIEIFFLPQQDICKKNLNVEIWSELTDSSCGAIELCSRCVLD